MGERLHRARPVRTRRGLVVLAVVGLTAGCGARGATTASPAVLTVEPCAEDASRPAVVCATNPITSAAPVEPARSSTPASTPPPTPLPTPLPTNLPPVPTTAVGPSPAPTTAAPAEGPTAAPEPAPAPDPAVEPAAEALPEAEPGPQPAPATSAKQRAPRTTLAPSPATVSGSVASRVVQLANDERAKAGLAPLAMDARLTAAAAAHSADQAATNHMDHAGSDGSSMADRVNASGYRWRALGENVAVGYRDAASVITGWMKSPGHRKNILTPDFTSIGVAVAAAADGTYYWTMDLGTGG